MDNIWIYLDRPGGKGHIRIEMKIGIRSLETLLSVAVLTMGACSLPGVSQEQDGPTIVLTAQEPVAEYSVRLCMDTPDIDYVEAWAQLHADAQRVEGAEPVTVTAVLDEVESDDPRGRAELTDSQRVEDALDVGLSAEGSWEGRAGRRCSEPEVVRFELEEASDGARVELDWVVVFGAEYDDMFRGGDVIDQEDLTIEIEAL